MKHPLTIIIAFVAIASSAFLYTQASSVSLDKLPASVLTSQTKFIKMKDGIAMPAVSAESYLVFDMSTEKVLLAHNERTVLPIASVTKLFTAALVMESFDISATTSIDWLDIATEGESGKLRFGDVYTSHELLFPLLLESSNDAATALMHLSKNELVARMNMWAAEQGAASTTFADASGLSAQNVSSAADLHVLLSAIFRQHPHVLDITKIPQYIGTNTGWRNNNPVYTKSGYLGGKHGYTPAAGRTQVALFNEEIDGAERTLGYIVLGSENSAADIQVLRDFITNSASLE